MYEFDGAGLAATQVGIEEQIFVGDSGDGPFIVNPQILRYLSNGRVLEEGCLSFPEIRISVLNVLETISVRYQNESGQ